MTGFYLSPIWTPFSQNTWHTLSYKAMSPIEKGTPLRIMTQVLVIFLAMPLINTISLSHLHEFLFKILENS